MPQVSFPRRILIPQRKKLYDGDYLVMMTDGVLDALPGDRTEQMKQLLLEVKNSEPREFARELLERVLRLGGCRARMI